MTNSKRTLLDLSAPKHLLSFNKKHDRSSVSGHSRDAVTFNQNTNMSFNEFQKDTMSGSTAVMKKNCETHIAIKISLVFMLMMLCALSISFAQKAPGGVSANNLELWLRADKGTSSQTDATTISTWEDLSLARINKPTSIAGTQQYRNNTRDRFNFNPVVNFDGNGGFSLGNDYIFVPAARNGLTMLSAVRPANAASTKSVQFISDIGMPWGTSYGFTYGNNFTGANTATSHGGAGIAASAHSFGTDGNIVSFDVNFKGTQSLRLRGAQFASSNVPSLVELNDAQISNEATPSLTGGPFTIGRQSTSLNITLNGNRAFQGAMGEYIHFGRDLSAQEIQRIESYLAVRYGVSLATAVNYLNSAGTTIWDATANATYHNNITAIGRDDASDLHQRQSKSSSSNGMVAIGNKGIIDWTNGNTASSGNDITTDKTFFFIGDNNQRNLFDLTPYSSTNYFRLYRVWKAQSVGITEPIRVSVPAFTSGDPNALPNIDAFNKSVVADNKVYLAIDPNGDNNWSDATYTEMSITGTGVTSAYEVNTTIPSGALFTFAIKKNTTDTDGDGVFDFDDLDDDNDGIADQLEMDGRRPLFAIEAVNTINKTITTKALSGSDAFQVNMALTGTGTLNNTVIGGEGLHFSVNTTSTTNQPFVMDYTITPVESDQATTLPKLNIVEFGPNLPKHYGGLAGGTNDNSLIALDWSNEDVVYAVVDDPYNQLSSHSTGDIIFPGAILNQNAGSITIRNYTTWKVTFYFRNADKAFNFKVTVTPNTGTSPVNNEFYGINLLSTRMLDDDQDGIPNHLDTDSDGDGCYDALEGGATASNSVEKFTSGLGVNGWADALSNNDSYFSTENYTTSYVFARSAAIKICKDTDGDVVRDNVDIDDDNDGILDKDEIDCGEAYFSVPNISTGLLGYKQFEGSLYKGQAFADYKINFFNLSGTLNNSTDVDISKGGLHYKIQNDAVYYTTQLVITPTEPSVISRIQFGPQTPSNSVAGTALVGVQTLKLEWNPDYKAVVHDPNGQLNVANGTVLSQGQSFSTTAARTVAASTWRIIFEGGFTDQEFDLRVQHSFATVPATAPYSQGWGVSTDLCYLEDFDNDDIPNHLDADSDNDGCPDAFEANATSDKSLFKFTGNVGANGLLNTLETNDTQSAQVNFAQTNYLAYSQVSACADTDGDGVPDRDDIDDDNDGILDSDEYLCGTATYINSYSIPTGVSMGAGGSFNNGDLRARSNYQFSDLTTLNTFTTDQNSSSYKVNDANGAYSFRAVISPNTSSLSQLRFGPSLEGNAANGAVSNAQQDITVTWSIPIGAIVVDPAGQLSSHTNGMGISSGAVLKTKQAYTVAESKWHIVIPINYLTRDFEFKVTFASATNFGDESFGVGVNLCSKSTDLDGDGKANAVDVDSDGDGCFDVVESKSAKYASLSSETLGGSYGTNGLSDLVKTNDTKLSTVNYTWSTDFLNKKITGCTDTDKDNIPNEIDIDDDNDGVIDETECASTPPVLSYTWQQDGAPTSSLAKYKLIANTGQHLADVEIAAIQNLKLSKFGLTASVNEMIKVNAKDNSVVGGIFDGANTSSANRRLQIKITPATSVAALDLDVLGTEGGNGGYWFHARQLKMDGGVAGNGTIVGIPQPYYLKEKYKVGDVITPTMPISTKFKNYLGPTTNKQFINVSFQQIATQAKPFVLTYNWNTIEPTFAGENYAFQILKMGVLLNENGPCDFDGDGIPNTLDTDSDNDGCNDGVESGIIPISSTVPLTGTVGANGFLNTLETQTDNNLPIADYSYPNALNKDINACPDFDNDGIGDLIDLDDDNDGVLDAVESPDCFMNPSDWNSMSRSNLLGVTSDLVTLDPNIKFSNLLDNNLTANAIQFLTSTAQNQQNKDIFKLQFWRKIQLDTIYIKKASATQIFGGTVMVQGSNDNVTWNDLLTTAVNPADATYFTANGSVILKNSNKLALNKNQGAYKYYRIRGITSANILAGIANEILFDVNEKAYNASAYPLTGNCNEDFDKDGKPNYQDLDSDADGCPDAVESKTVSNTTDQTVSAPYGVNGFGDGVETVAESSIYKSTYSYFYAVNKSITRCTDTDKDGIPDTEDLDSDNDGVLDNVESPGCAIFESLFKEDFGIVGVNPKMATWGTTNFTDSISLGNGDGPSLPVDMVPGYTWAWSDGDRYAQDGQYAVVSFPKLGGYGLWLPGSDYSTKDSTVKNGGMLLINGANPGQVAFRKVATNLVPGKTYQFSARIGDIYPAGTIRPDLKFQVKNSAGVIVTSVNTGAVTNNIGGATLEFKQYVLQFVATTSQMTLELVSISTSGNGNDYVIDDVDLRICLGTLADTDKDGVPNYLDLDSDGDGCNDSYEGGVTTIKTKAVIDGPYDTNGFANSLETAQESGIYSKTYTYAQRAVFDNINACIDSDNDGVSDLDDLDDDNDGVLDNIECNTAPKKILIAASTENFQNMKSNWINDFRIGAPVDATIVENNIIETATVPSGMYDGYDMVVFGGAAFNTVHPNHWIALKTAIKNKTSKSFVIEADNCCVTGNRDSVISLLNSLYGTNYIASTTKTTVNETYTLNPNNFYADVFTAKSLAGAIYYPVLNVADEDILFYSPAVPGAALAGMKMLPDTKEQNRFIGWFADGTITQDGYYATNQGQIGRAFYDAYASKSPRSCDTDGDGVPNNLDSDSDGDGCPDAVEAGVTKDKNKSVIDGEYGVNGFANSVETATESGIYKSTYTYNRATNKNINACIDTDNDGILNIDDLDDDNDGVLDEEECAAASLIDGYSLYTYNRTDDQFVATNVPVTIVGSTTQKIILNQRIAGNDITYSGSSWKSLASNLFADKDGKITVTIRPGDTTINGNYVFADAMLISDGNRYWLINDRDATLSLTGSWSDQNGTNYPSNKNYRQDMYYAQTPYTGKTASWTFTNLFGTVAATCDADNDGTPNHMDPDSDGDGCNDAVEAGVLPLGGTVPVAGTETSNYGANGFANTLETATESGRYKDVYTYTYATNKTVNACNDKDGDGISDVLDIDDDNDGILDVTECGCAGVKPSVAEIVAPQSLYTSPTNQLDNPLYTWSKSAYALDGSGLSATPTTLSSVAAITHAFPSKITNAAFLADNSGLGYDWNFNLGAPTLVKGFVIWVPPTANYTGGDGPMKKIQINATTCDGNVYQQTVDLGYPSPNAKPILFTGPIVTSSLKLKVLEVWFSTTQAGSTTVGQGEWINYQVASSVPIEYNTTLGEFRIISSTGSSSVSCSVDSDGDGTPNYLDLDSDGDGCNDATEGGSRKTATAAGSSTSNQGVIIDTYGANGLANTLETADESGIYKASYTYNRAITNTINSCTDTDGDGVIDVDDLDDDNDGVLDTHECAATVPYKVYTTSRVDPVFTSAAPFEAVGSYTAKQYINQRVAGTDLTYDNKTWSLITSEMTPDANGKITVKLKPNAASTDGYILADGVLITNGINTFTLDNQTTNSSNFILAGAWISQNVVTSYQGDEAYLAPGDHTGKEVNWIFLNLPTLASCDFDNDGIPSHLDVDADGDGCSDAFETGTTKTKTTSVIAAPYGDNGFADALEKTAPESGVYNGTYSYDYANNKSINICIDTDNDGVPDLFDVDDDNDGVLDISERACDQVITIAGTNGGTKAENTAPPGWTKSVSSPDIADASGHVYGPWNIGCSGIAPLPPNGHLSWMSFFSNTQEAFKTTINNLVPGKSYSLKVNYGKFAALGIGLGQVTVKLASTVIDQYTPTVGCGWDTRTITFTPTASSQELQFQNTGPISAAYNTNISLSANAVSPVCIDLDNDNDGIPNHLDLDSDNDGCSDANEAYSLTNAQGTDNNMYYGDGNPPAVNADGSVTTASYSGTNTNVTTAGSASVITIQPLNQNIQVGETTTFTTAVTPGSGTTAYQWQVSTDGGLSWSNVANTAPYSGATTTTLTVTNANIGMQGYRFRLSIKQSNYVCGDLTSSVARLLIGNVPSITDDIQSSEEDKPVTGNLFTNDKGSGGSALTITSIVISGVSSPVIGEPITLPEGTLQVNADGSYTFTPTAEYSGPVPTVTYTAKDANGGIDSGNLDISITPVNDAPVATDDAVTATEDQTMTTNVLTNDTDPEKDPLKVTTFTLNGETYNAGDTATIDGVGTLVIDSTGKVTFKPEPDFAGNVPAITYEVVDGNGGKDIGTLNITMSPVNDAPVAENDENTATEDEPVTGNLLTNDSDIDTPTLTVTSATIAGVSTPVTIGTPITITEGTLVINADGTYTFTPTTNYNGTVPVITYVVSDGTATDTAELSIDIAPANDSPVAADDAMTVTENQPATYNLLTNDTDPDGDPLIVTIFMIEGQTYNAGETVTIAGVGTVVISSTGSVTFTPDLNFSGTVPPITYEVSDGNGGKDTGELIITMSPVNDAPIAVNDSKTATEDLPVTGNLLTNDSDIDSPSLTITSATIAGVSTPVTIGTPITIVEGTLVVNADGTYTFTPTANYNGTVPVITYVVSDGTATDTAELSIDVKPANDVPVSAPDTKSTAEGSTATGNVLTNDKDADGDVLTVTQFKVGTQTYAAGQAALISGVGELTLNADGSYTFIPAPGYNGSVPTITYTLSDGNGGTGTNTLDITVTPVNDPPVALTDLVFTPEDTPVSGSVLANDSDVDSGTLTITSYTVNGNTVDAGIVTTIAGVGDVIVNADGSFTFTPTADYTGTIPVVTYEVTDGTSTSTADLELKISPATNDAPAAVADVVTLSEDTSVSNYNVLNNDSDVDGDVIELTQFKVNGVTYLAGSTATIPGVGTLVISATGTVTFVPEENYNGNVPEVVYTITDGVGGTATSTLNITVNPVNDAPKALPDTEDTNGPVSGALLTNDSDIDGDPLTVTNVVITGVSTPVLVGTPITITEGTLVVNANGSYTFTPTGGFDGPVPTITYTVSDGKGGTASSTLDILVTSLPDPPLTASAVVETTPEDTPIYNNVILGNVSGGTATPTLTEFTIDGITYKEGETASIPGVGNVVMYADGSYTFTPSLNYNGAVPTITYKIVDSETDGEDGIAVSTLNITVSPVNDAPVALTDNVTTAEDSPATGSVLTNDSDVDSATLTVTSFTVSGTTSIAGTPTTIDGVGDIVVNADGSFTFTPTTNYAGPVPVVSYVITDGTATATADLKLSITPVNDVPVAIPDAATTPEDKPVSGNVLTDGIDDSDVDGDALTLTQYIINGISYSAGQKAIINGIGEIMLNADGSYTFTPTTNYNGAVPTITYTVSDGNGGTATSKLSITVTPVNDPPVALTDVVTLEEDTPVTGNVLDNDSDVDSGTLTVTSFTVSGTTVTAGNAINIPNVGDIIVSEDGSFTFTPAANYNGSVPTITYEITDGTATATADLKLSITPVNDAPLTVPDVATTPEDTPVSGNVLTDATTEDSDVDGDVLTLTQYAIGGITYNAGQTTTIPGVGEIKVNANGSYTFTPTANYNGPVPEVVYTVNDGNGETATSTLNITVAAENDGPVAVDDTNTFAEDTPAFGTLLTNDSDIEKDVLKVTGVVIAGVSTPVVIGTPITITEGTLVVNADGTYTFTPTTNYNGAVPTITYTITDGTATATANLILSITPMNDDPVVVNETETIPQGTIKSGNVLTNDSDTEGKKLSVGGIFVNRMNYSVGQTVNIPNVGTIVVESDGSYTFTPFATYFGTVPEVIYTVSDGDGGTVTGTLNIAVSAVDTDGDGIPDEVEKGPDPANPIDTDKDGIPDYLDLDSDGDGLPDSVEDSGCSGVAPCTPTDTDGDGTPNYLDLDSDGDGIPDAVEDNGCTGVEPCAPTDTDGDKVPDYLDLDSDGDGIPDAIEKGPDGNNPVDTDKDGIPDYLDLDSDGDGIPDAIEKGADGNNPVDTDKDGIPDYLDLDSDGDGIPDAIEKGADGYNPVDTDGDNIPDYLDLDSDGDGIPDAIEAGADPENPVDTDGDNIPDYLDLDSDGDGIPDAVEAGADPENPVDTDGDKIPDYLDLDSDGDGIPDAVEKGADGNNPVDTDGDKIPDYLDLDSDGDGIPDAIEKGADGNNPVDTDKDGIPDYLDLDSDGDGIPDAIEKGADGNNPVDTDGDKIPDYLDLDSDGDGIPDAIEKGADGNNPVDTDGDKTPDYLDLDSDGDGIPDAVEAGEDPENPVDTDGDKIPDYLDLDSDGDGIPDAIEKGADGNNPVDTDKDGIPDYLDLDSDNDGIPDAREDKGCTGTAPCTPTDTDGDKIPDYLDLDSDGDAIPDAIEKGADGNSPIDTDKDGIPDYLDLDSDNDGIPDAIEDKGCTGRAPCTPTDTDSDGIPDYLDLDSDGDGITDLVESGLNPALDHDGDGMIDNQTDTDKDGLPDLIDPNNGGTPAPIPDTDGDGTPDFQDLDSDNDGIPDLIEAGVDPKLDANGDGVIDNQTDTDKDGLVDAVDPDNGGTPAEVPDTDGDGHPDFQDLDSDNDGILDSVEKGPDANNPVDTDGDGTPDYLDLDSDGDGITDLIEGGLSPALDKDGDGMIDNQKDTDGDGLADVVDPDHGGTPASVPDTDGDGTPDYLDLDSDGDGITDLIESGLSATLDKDGDGVIDNQIDTDNDGLPDVIDPDNGGTPTPVPDTDGDGKADFRDLDSDNDGIPDLIEAGVDPKLDANGDGVIDSQTDIDNDGLVDALDPDNGGTPAPVPDTDGDGKPNFQDIDSDGDGIPDSIEKGADGNNPVDTDKDGIPDYLDLDSDNDGILDALEKGVDGNNPVDTDKDGIPDYRDLDSDNDGLSDVIEADGADQDGDGMADGTPDANGVPFSARGGLTPPDTDKDGKPDFQDVDSDSDGIPDNKEGQGTYVTPTGKDSDGDGLDDAYDKSSGGTPIIPADTDSDGKPDFRELDSDNDGIPDAVEAGPDPKNPLDTDGDGTPDYRDLDSDNDGIPDTIEKGADGQRPVDTDGDGTPDYRDLDADGDGQPDSDERGIDGLRPLDSDGNGIPDFLQVDDIGEPADIILPDVSICYGTTATLEPRTTTVPNAAFKWYSDPALTNLVWAGDFYTTPVVTRTMKFYVTVNGTNVKENRPYNAKEVTVTPNAKFTAPVVSADGELKICSDEDRKLSVVMPAGSSIQWYRDGAAISGATKDTLTVNQTGSYTAILTSSTGCISDPSAPKLIEIVCQTGIMMPDVFTPNGDGDNEVIMPIVPGIKRLRCFEVYNRWGNLIFTTDQIGKGWDGTFRGKHQPAETYLWNIEGVDSKGRKVKKTGMFTLIR